MQMDIGLQCVRVPAVPNTALFRGGHTRFWKHFKLFFVL